VREKKSKSVGPGRGKKVLESGIGVCRGISPLKEEFEQTKGGFWLKSGKEKIGGELKEKGV